jgi:phosphatidylserine decarboxylase
VQPCDCRLVVFCGLDTAQQLWIKGHRFSLQRLLGCMYSSSWDGCSVVLSRLAPGDHHRFYMPCRGRISSMVLMQGDLYSVKPVSPPCLD